MLRGLFLLCAYLAFFGIGIATPFIFTLGYVWVDTLRPTDIVYGVLKGIPFSFMMAGAAVGSYILMDRRDPPRIGAITVLSVTFAIWVTLTCFWAVVPDAAWVKWGYAFKSILLPAFIPLVIRSRNQIEAFIQVFIFSLAANMIPLGAKTLVTGGGYGQALGLSSGNALLAEGSTLSLVSLVAIPLILYLMKHERIFPRNRLTQLGYVGLIGLALLTTIGTHERTGLVGMVVLAATVWMKSKRKLMFGSLCVAIAILIVFAAPDSWTERMATISTNPQETGAMGRLLVWKWTLGYVAQHPLGGGFDAYRINVILYPNPDGSGYNMFQRARAFHSSYFEVLGEHGWVGLGLYLGMIYASFRSLSQAARHARGQPSLLWVSDLSNALRSSLLIFMACSAFIGVAFQQTPYYLFALAFTLREYVRRIEQAPARVATQRIEDFAVARS